MPGTITLPDPWKRHLGQSPSYIYEATLTLDAAGNLSNEGINVDPGYLTAVETIPDADTPPSDEYTLQLLNEYGVDLLAGGGAGRSATLPQRLKGAPTPLRNQIYPTIALGGAGGKLVLVLYVQGA